ncbi:hypothetical protein D3C81_1276350 [compost metagenome]
MLYRDSACRSARLRTPDKYGASHVSAVVPNVSSETSGHSLLRRYKNMRRSCSFRAFSVHGRMATPLAATASSNAPVI